MDCAMSLPTFPWSALPNTAVTPIGRYFGLGFARLWGCRSWGKTNVSDNMAGDNMAGSANFVCSTYQRALEDGSLLPDIP